MSTARGVAASPFIRERDSGPLFCGICVEERGSGHAQSWGTFQTAPSRPRTAVIGSGQSRARGWPSEAPEAASAESCTTGLLTVAREDREDRARVRASERAHPQSPGDPAVEGGQQAARHTTDTRPPVSHHGSLTCGVGDHLTRLLCSLCPVPLLTILSQPGTPGIFQLPEHPCVGLYLRGAAAQRCFLSFSLCLCVREEIEAAYVLFFFKMPTAGVSWWNWGS